MPYKTLEERRAWYAANREKSIARAAKWAKDNRDRNNATRRKAYEVDPDRVLAEVYAWREANPELYAYTNHKSHAKRRKVPFLLTFEEWWSLWDASGKFTERGHKKGQYVMARFRDEGPYAIGNVRICTVEENHAEAWKLKPDRHRHRRKSASSKTSRPPVSSPDPAVSG